MFSLNKTLLYISNSGFASRAFFKPLPLCYSFFGQEQELLTGLHCFKHRGGGVESGQETRSEYDNSLH